MFLFSVCDHRERFRCDSSRCIPLSWRCDGFVDCNDFTDEKNCSNCSSTQFYCGNNVCIDKDNICDGIIDCPDGRDERQCSELNEAYFSHVYFSKVYFTEAIYLIYLI